MYAQLNVKMEGIYHCAQMRAYMPTSRDYGAQYNIL